MEAERSRDLITHFRVIDQEAETNQRYTVFEVPKKFSTQNISRLLSNIVWGEEIKMVIIRPKNSDNTEIISHQELKVLRDFPVHDRNAQLDADSLRIKAADIALVVELKKTNT